MRRALNESEVSRALKLALTPAVPAIEERSEISSILHAIARDCRWGVADIHWRPIYCTFHLCFVSTSAGARAIVVGADAPILAMSDTSRVGDELCFVDDAAFSSAVSGYGGAMNLLLAAELTRDLSEADEAWLIGLGPHMAYNLNYWRPQTVAEVIFNTWD